MQVCSACHDPNVAAGPPRTPGEWDAVLSQMQGFGAVASPEEFAAIRGYLLQTFGKVNINTASAADIGAVLQLKPDVSSAVVAYRNDHGAFKSADELKLIPGIDMSQVTDRQNRIQFQ